MIPVAAQRAGHEPHLPEPAGTASLSLLGPAYNYNDNRSLASPRQSPGDVIVSLASECVAWNDSAFRSNDCRISKAECLPAMRSTAMA